MGLWQWAVFFQEFQIKIEILVAFSILFIHVLLASEVLWNNFTSKKETLEVLESMIL